MAARIAEKDWSQTPLGPVEHWSPALRMMVEHLLGNGFGLLLWWGPNYIQLYNDAYRPVLGTKHPHSLGQPAAECWPEIWDVIAPMIERPYRGGAPSVTDELELEVDRYGYLEETHFTVAYSPVYDATAQHGIGGVVATVHETTRKVIGERRMRLLSDLGVRTAEAKTAHEACRIAAAVLSQHPKDVPFAMLYLMDRAGSTAQLVAATGVDAFGAIESGAIDLQGATPSPLAEALSTKRSVAIADLSDVFPQFAGAGIARSALAVSISAAPPNESAGVLIAGASPLLTMDDDYKAFFDLVASPIATAITNARAYEEERKRADALAEIDRVKNDFFSNVSHEFRTPLTLMLGPLGELALRIDGDCKPLVEAAQRNALRLLKLVNTLLEFSRIQAGRADPAYASTDLATLTGDLCGAFRSAIESGGLGFVVDVGLAEPAFVDRTMWEKIVLNLLSNALKFTLSGEIGLSLTRDGADALLTVRDTGGGIPEEELPRVFERFRRVRSVAARSHEGSGIGLALCKDLVTLHGGTIDVESAVGAGSTFRVRVPLGRGHLDAAKIVSEPVAQPDTASVVEQYRAEIEATTVRSKARAAARAVAGAPRPCILLADDNADLRDYVHRILSPYADVDAVSNGERALARLRERRYDLVLSDVMMPGMDGLELLAAVRADANLADMPFVFLSARAGEEAAVEGLDRGADGYLVKPFSAEELIARVEALVRRAELFERKSRIARSFQDAALPASLPEVPGLVFSALYEPASVADRVGGDFYDAFRLADGRVVVSIGDVAGSGLDAAATMSALRQSIRAAANINPDPALLLKAADGIFTDAGPAPFATAFVAVIDPLTFSMRFANAGHSPPLLRTPNGDVVELTESALLLGIRARAEYGRRVGCCTIEPGSVLVLYTDGLTESQHDPVDGERRLEQAVRALSATPHAAPAMTSEIHDGVLGKGGTSADDLAVLTVLFYLHMGDADTVNVRSWSFSCDDALRAYRVRSEIAAMLRARGLSREDVFAAETIYAELVGNTVRHARGEIGVVLDLTRPEPVLHVLDQGPGFSLNPKLPNSPYAERGRGLYIISELAVEFTANPRTLRGGAHARVVLCGLATPAAEPHPQSAPAIA